MTSYNYWLSRTLGGGQKKSGILRSLVFGAIGGALKGGKEQSETPNIDSVEQGAGQGSSVGSPGDESLVQGSSNFAGTRASQQDTYQRLQSQQRQQRLERELKDLEQLQRIQSKSPDKLTEQDIMQARSILPRYAITAPQRGRAPDYPVPSGVEGGRKTETFSGVSRSGPGQPVSGQPGGTGQPPQTPNPMLDQLPNRIQFLKSRLQGGDGRSYDTGQEMPEGLPMQGGQSGQSGGGEEQVDLDKEMPKTGALSPEERQATRLETANRLADQMRQVGSSLPLTGGGGERNHENMGAMFQQGSIAANRIYPDTPRALAYIELAKRAPVQVPLKYNDLMFGPGGSLRSSGPGGSGPGGSGQMGSG